MMIDKDMLEAMGQLLDSKLEKALEPINGRLDRMESEITKINVTLENETNKNIKILLEGQQGINEKFQKLDKVAEDVEEIKVKVTALEEVTRSNTSQIEELRIAK